MVSNFKILQCIRKLWPGHENPDGWTHLLTNAQTPNGRHDKNI